MYFILVRNKMINILLNILEKIIDFILQIYKVFINNVYNENEM